jgi:hypothetical protein
MGSGTRCRQHVAARCTASSRPTPYPTDTYMGTVDPSPPRSACAQPALYLARMLARPPVALVAMTGTYCAQRLSRVADKREPIGGAC